MRPVPAERDLGAKRAAARRERKGSERRKVLRSKPVGRLAKLAEFPERPVRGRLPTLRWCPFAHFPVCDLSKRECYACFGEVGGDGPAGGSLPVLRGFAYWGRWFRGEGRRSQVPWRSGLRPVSRTFALGCG